MHKVAVEHGHTDTCSLMAWGYNPFISEKSPYHGAYLAVVESVSKLIATGASFSDVYLTFQEYFEKPMKDQKRWGKPLAALLGAFRAQLDFEIAAIGGKDSMSGSFEDIDVPPTLVSFAVTTESTNNIMSPEFKAAGHKVALLKPDYDENGLPKAASVKAIYKTVSELVRQGSVKAAYTPGLGGVAEAVLKMCLGNSIGFRFADSVTLEDIFSYCYGAFVLELDGAASVGEVLGETIDAFEIQLKNETVSGAELLKSYEETLEPIFPSQTDGKAKQLDNISYMAENRVSPKMKMARPKVLIPVFPGTNCEYDTAKALETAGAEADIFVIKNLTPQAVSESTDAFAKKLSASQIMFVPGGFSGGDEPDGSGKFITAFMRNAVIKQKISNLLNQRDGLICGICNGFQALIKLGLVPFGEIIDTDETCPTLTYNTIGRHQSRLVRTRIASNKSPWLSKTNVGDVYTVPISHGEGRFIASDEVLQKMIANGQIATQYVDLDGNATTDILFNPNGSVLAIEGITSPDGRVFGKMGHSERIGNGLYKNVPGKFDMGMFEAAVEYFK